MLSRMQRLKQALIRRSDSRKPGQRDVRSLRTASLRLALEGLEQRVVMATVSWVPLTGGEWELASNWSGDKVPTAGDDVVIDPTDASGNPIGMGTITFNNAVDAANSITTSSKFSLQFNAATFALGAGSSTLAAGVDIVSGAAVTVAPSAKFQLTGATLMDNGALSFGASDAVGLLSSPGTAQITVTSGGLLNATNTTISTLLPTGATTPPPTFIQINSGGHLTGTGNTFGDTITTIANGAILNSNDLTGNDFSGTVLTLPVIDVPLVTNNTKFREVDLLGGSLPTNTTLSLTAMGTLSPVQEYKFTGNYTVPAGATLSVDPNIFLYNQGNTLTVNGTLIFGKGDSVELFNAQYVVNGLMTSSSTSFFNDPGAPPPANLPASGPTSLVVNPGGHLIGSGNSFGFTTTTLNNGSVLNSGDLTGNNFAVVFQPLNPAGVPSTTSILVLPLVDVPLITNNTSFAEVDLLGGTLAAGPNVPLTIPLTAMGTAGSPNLFYALVGDYTIGMGEAVAVDPNIKLYDNGHTLTDNGTLTFNPTDLVTFNAGGSTIAVGTGGVLTTTSATFVNRPGVTGSQIVVNSGGHLTGTGNTFSASSTSINNGAILNTGDLTGNNFANTVLALPAIDVPLVTNNRQFAEVDLLAGTLPASTTLPLTLMGTTSTITLFYVFVGNFTVASQATLTVNPNIPVFNNAALTVNGTLNVLSGDNLTLNGGSIAVGGGGVANVSEANILTGSGTTSITANSGGTLIIVGSAVAPTQLIYGPGSSGSLTISTLATTLTVDSTATATISGDNLSQIGANGAVATGDPTAHINLKNNYWGTTNVTQIAGMILDHNDDATRPTIDFLPIVSGVAGVASANVTTGFSSGTQNLTLSAAVSSVTGTVNEGSVTFAILSGTTVIGTATTANVVNGLATVAYALPGGTAQGVYQIQAEFNGTANYLPAIDTSHALTVTRASATVGVPTAGLTATYNATTNQAVALHASITSGAGTVNEGTVTFTVMSGTTTIGTPVTVNVVNGSADGSYSLLAGTSGGTYTVNVAFNGSTDYTASGSSTLSLLVKAAPTTIAAGIVATGFSTSAQSIGLQATVASPDGTVSQGAVTFTLFSGSTVIGTPVTVNVIGGNAAATYSLPPGTVAGSYQIAALYAGTVDFAVAGDNTRLLTVTRVGTTTTAASAASGYNSAAKTVQLTANVTSPAGAVNEGSVTFQVLSGTTVIGSATSATVAAGVATVAYALPGGLATGSTFSIQANYGGSADYLASANSASSTSGTLTIVKATPAVTATTDLGSFNPQTETIVAHATVLNGGTNVNEGTLSFQVMNGTTAVGSPVVVPVVNGVASTSLTLPGGTPVGTGDSVVATYSGSGNYLTAASTALITLAPIAPVITWPTPASIVFGQPLTAAQLDATASVPGKFTYTPALGTLLSAAAGQTLTVSFAPTDTADYTAATAATTINVTPAIPLFTGLSGSQISQFAQAAITVSGHLAASTAIPIGASVAILLTSGTTNVAATAIVQNDGSFSQVVNIGSLPVGTYKIEYGFPGNASFFGAFDASTTLNVVQSTQTLITFDPPTSAVYGAPFHVDLVSSAGLPVTLTATNATVTPSATGGYDVSLTSGSLNAVLTATQAGNANVSPTTTTSATVLAVKAQASLQLASLGVYYDGNAHTVTAATNPSSLNYSLTYTLNGVAVAAPTAIGTYVATATINDANYQGTATSQVVIVPYVNPTPVPVLGPVSLQSLQYTTNKHKAITTITLNFKGPLNSSSATNVGNYRLAVAGIGGNYDGRFATTYKVKSATYNATNDSVTLTIAKPFVLKKALQVRVYGSPGHGLLDGLNRLIDGKHAGVFGGDENATINKSQTAV